MAWPTPSDYQDAIQNPQTCFQDSRLRPAQPALGPLGLPKVASGNYCSVYELRAGSRRWAVRCFNRHVPDMKRRYRTIDDHLNLHPKLPWIVGFDYLDPGIRIHGRWYPIVVMDWVEGSTLSRYLEKRVRDSAAVLALAEQWPRVLADLRASEMAHGDLQHGNVMVASEAIRLVDYDNLFVPDFRGERSPELGRLHYQHPRRSADDFDENIGNFAALVIYLSLRALAADSSLWQYYNGENLVLTADDFQRPGASTALAKMRSSPDPLVPPLAAELARCCALPVSQVPPLEAALAGVGAAGPPRSAAPAAGPRPSGGRPDWLDSAGPSQAPAPVAPAPGRGRTSRRPAPPPASAPGGGWWDEATAPSPAAPPARRGGRRPTGMPSRGAPGVPGGTAGGSSGTVALPRGPRTAAPRAGGWVASLVRSCLVLVVLAWVLAAGAVWWVYQTWERTGQLPSLPPITIPRFPVPQGPPPRELPEARPPGPPGTIPLPPRSRPEADRSPEGDGATGRTNGKGRAPAERTPEPPGPPSPRQPATGSGARGKSPRPSTAASLALLQQAERRLRAGEAAAALAALNEARSRGLSLNEPRTAGRYYAALAEARFRNEQYAASLDPFEQALRRTPADDRLRLLFGEVLEVLGRVTRAHEQYERVATGGRTLEHRREARRRLDRLGLTPGASA